MRNIKELLELMLNNQPEICGGLCSWINILFSNKKITNDEYFLLQEYVKKNRPSKWTSFRVFMNRNEAYYWPSYFIEYRIKWIEKHIKLNSK